MKINARADIVSDPRKRLIGNLTIEIEIEITMS